MKKNTKNQKNIVLVRKPCNCMAREHDLINNCLNCGKIVCAQQGQGPCFFCQHKVLKNHSNYIDLDDKQMFPQLVADVQKAIQHRDTLIKRDQNKQLNNNIYDQQMDYYQLANNQWASKQDRKIAINRILVQQQINEEQILANRGHYDLIKNQWVIMDYIPDTQKFKIQGQNYNRKIENEKKNNQNIQNIEISKHVKNQNKIRINKKFQQTLKIFSLNQDQQNEDQQIYKKCRPKIAKNAQIFLELQKQLK